MDNINRVSEAIYDILANAFNVEMYDENMKSTVVPGDARFFTFPYVDDGEEFATMNIGVFPNKTVKIATDQAITDKMTPEQSKRFMGLKKRIRKEIMPYMFRFDQFNFNRGRMQPKDWIGATKDSETIDKNAVGLNEAALTGTSLSSYQQLENVRIIVRHSKHVNNEARGARSRNIEKIYVENGAGERFLLPEGTSLNGARAFARHVKNGGSLTDDFGQHIGKMIKEMSDLRVFVRNMRGRVFEDAETTAMVEAAIDHYGALHRDLFTLRGQRGYEKYRELWQPDALTEDDLDISALRERFTRKVFDERLLDALPIVARAFKTRQESVAEEFESWANGVTEAVAGDAEEVNPNGQASPMSFTDAGGDDASDMDAPQSDKKIDAILDRNGFMVSFSDGVYYFESKQEIDRAKDILAQEGINWKKLRYGVSDYGYGVYGSTTFDRTLDLDKGVKESVSKKQDVVEVVDVDDIHAEALREHLLTMAEGYILKKTGVSKHTEPGDYDEYIPDVNSKDTDYEIINNKTGQTVGTASWTTNDYFGPGALKITMNNGATRYLDIRDSEKGNPQTAFNRFVKDPKTAKKYKEQGVAEAYAASLNRKFLIPVTASDRNGKTVNTTFRVKAQSAPVAKKKLMQFLTTADLILHDIQLGDAEEVELTETAIQQQGVAEGKVSGYKMYQNADGSWYVEDADENVVLRNASRGEAEHAVSAGNKKLKKAALSEDLNTLRSLAGLTK